MSYILIPQIVSSSTAMIWVGAIDEKVRINPVYLEYNVIGEQNAQSIKLNPSEWRTWKTRHPLEKTGRAATVSAIHYQRVTIGIKEKLQPRTKYVVKLKFRDKSATADEDQTPAKVEGTFQDYSQTLHREVTEEVEYPTHFTKATVTTLPERLPGSGDKPFKVLLGSCFYLPNDLDEGLVGRTFLNLPADEQPEIKFLCGDQVYLDNPWTDTTWNVALARSPKENMRRFFFEKYIQTWTQVKKETITDDDGEPKEKAVGGFNLLLRNGANYFCPDDHEFWNNAPNFGGVGAALTLFRGQRRWWFRESAELFRLFQSLAPWMTFDVPPLSFCIIDTRSNRLTHNVIRSDETAVFMEEDDLEAVGEWIKNLKGPGVLVMGQIMLAKKANFRKTFKDLDDAPFFTRLKESFSQYFDFGLADFPGQYKRLCDYIQNSKHSIVVLSGDVHFGRVAVCDLNTENGTKFVEVISSPMSVVSITKKKLGLGSYEEAPEIFQGAAMKNFKIAEQKNHFATLGFNLNDDGSVKMTVKSWEIFTSKNEKEPKTERIHEIDLK